MRNKLTAAATWSFWHNHKGKLWVPQTVCEQTAVNTTEPLPGMALSMFPEKPCVTILGCRLLYTQQAAVVSTINITTTPTAAPMSVHVFLLWTGNMWTHAWVADKVDVNSDYCACYHQGPYLSSPITFTASLALVFKPSEAQYIT